MELALGTVQFGLPYGAAAGNTLVTPSNTERILEQAVESSIRIFDTALAYGESQKRLGAFLTRSGNKGLRVITKTRAKLRYATNPGAALEDDLASSLRDLEQSSIYGLLIHDVDDICSFASRSSLLESLTKVKQRGLVSKIGFSSYSAEEIDEVLRYWLPDIIQVPVNVLDQRLVESCTIQRIKDLGIEIHIRSAFLQGIALMEPNSLPNHLEPLRATIREIRDFGCPMEVALGFLKTQTPADVIIVGVHSEEQLTEIIRIWERMPAECDYRRFAVSNPALIDPRQWPQ